jgi:hypothetical protein
MRKIIVFSLFVVSFLSCFSQQTNPSNALTKEEYLQKSKHQKTAAWVLLGGGLALGVTGIIVDASNWESSGGDVLLVLGGVSMISSIPLFIASGKNKKRAMAASTFFKLEKIRVVHGLAFSQRAFPAVSLKINL